MATPLDITALQHFTGIFPFLLVLILVYAILTRTPIFKERQGMAAVIAVLAALMTLFSQIAIKTINMMAPWFVLFIIFGILMMLAYMSFGVSEKTVMDVITGDNYGGAFSFWVLSIMLIIGLGSLFTVINEQKAIAELAGGEERVDTGELGFWQTLFHPKVLGMIVVLLIAFFTIGKMASSE